MLFFKSFWRLSLLSTVISTSSTYTILYMQLLVFITYLYVNVQVTV